MTHPELNLQPNNIYAAATIQALTYLDTRITATAKRSKKIALGMTLFADRLAHSAAGREPRPTLRKTMRRGPLVLEGWNLACALTYPFLGDLQP